MVGINVYGTIYEMICTGVGMSERKQIALQATPESHERVSLLHQFLGPSCYSHCTYSKHAFIRTNMHFLL